MDIALAVALGAALLSPAFGWFILAPVIFGFKPFTTPAQAARGERRRRRWL